MQVHFRGYHEYKFMKGTDYLDQKDEDNFKQLGDLIKSKIDNPKHYHITDDTIIAYTGTGTTAADKGIDRFVRASGLEMAVNYDRDDRMLEVTARRYINNAKGKRTLP